MFPNRSSSQYNSTTSGRDQLTIRSPRAGSYVFISVYSKGNDSRYSIIVTGEGRLITLYTYGNLIENEVAAGRARYYVLTVPMYNSFTDYTLAFTLRALSGNPDLFISTVYRFPNATHSNWTSQAAGDGLDMVVLTGNVDSNGRSQLQPGNYYVSVRGTTDAEYQLWAYLRLRQNVEINSVNSYYHSGGVIHWQVDVPRGAEFSVMARPATFYGGSFNLYVGNVAEPLPSVSNTYQVMGNGAVRVTPSVSACVGSGSTCRYYIAVERVNGLNETSYASFTMLVFSPSVPPTPLLADVPLEKGLNAPGGFAYQFNVSCARAKVSVMLVVTGGTGGSADAPMSINRGPLPPFLHSQQHRVRLRRDRGDWAAHLHSHIRLDSSSAARSKYGGRLSAHCDSSYHWLARLDSTPQSGQQRVRSRTARDCHAAADAIPGHHQHRRITQLTFRFKRCPAHQARCTSP